MATQNDFNDVNVEATQEIEQIFDVNKLHYKMAPDYTPKRSWSFQEIHWSNFIFLTLAHIGGLYGLYLFLLGTVHFKTFLFALALYIYGGFGITAGAHRLWTHRSYEAKAPLQIFLMLCNCIALQGSIYHWCRDHVLHHKFSESVADPHDARRGFFFSHIGWLCLKKQPEVGKIGKQFSFSWLKKNPIVMFQHKYYVVLALLLCFAMPCYICSFWGDAYNGLFFAGFFRYAWTFQATCCVNSVAHLIGMRPYDPEISPSESLLTSLVSFGEGWHNYHHTYPYDYACSEFGVLSQYNPTKLFIDFNYYLGLATNLKRRNSLEKKEF